MNQFTVNKDMFGQYCHIPTDTSGKTLYQAYCDNSLMIGGDGE